MESPWIRLKSRTIYEDAWLRIFSDDVIQLNGKQHTRSIIRTRGGAGAVAITENRELCLVGQYRYPIDSYSLEIPKGAFDSFDSQDQPISVAKRELKEETGIVAENWTELAMIHTMTGYSDDRVFLFLATGLTFGESSPDETELIRLFFVPLSDIREVISKGLIVDGERVMMTDATSISAILLAEQTLNNGG